MSVSEKFQQLEAHASGLIIGQTHLINRMLIALLCDGHLLVEGAPGLAKTRAIKVLSESVEGSFHRLQFTPDLLPADLTGTEIYRPQEGTFEFREGPLFHNLILADEINRAPAKVQSALLEAMEERQITVGEKSYKLAGLFMVMATQNPIEQEGTYPLPEAQLDRFLLHVEVGYPSVEDERRILRLNRDEARSGDRDAFAPPEVLSESRLWKRASRFWACTSPTSSSNTLSTSSLQPAIRGASMIRCRGRSCTVPVPAPVWVSTARHVPAPGSWAATTSVPKISRKLRRTCCGIAWC